MRSFAGVGVKCANLALGIACGQPKISVDIHVHRIVNRWGYVHTTSPEQTTIALEAKLPREHWITINAPARPLRQARLHRRRPQVLDLPGPGDVPAGGRHQPPVAGTDWASGG